MHTWHFDKTQCRIQSFQIWHLLLFSLVLTMKSGWCLRLLTRRIKCCLSVYGASVMQYVFVNGYFKSFEKCLNIERMMSAFHYLMWLKKPYSAPPSVNWFYYQFSFKNISLIVDTQYLLKDEGQNVGFVILWTNFLLSSYKVI